MIYIDLRDEDLIPFWGIHENLHVVLGKEILSFHIIESIKWRIKFESEEQKTAFTLRYL